VPGGFLRAWVAINVKVVHASHLSQEAKRLAAVCAAEAARSGIDPDVLDAAACGDLEKYMVKAIDNVTMAEFDKLLARVSSDATRAQGPEATD
jgi:hypothetical protein